MGRGGEGKKKGKKLKRRKSRRAERDVYEASRRGVFILDGGELDTKVGRCRKLPGPANKNCVVIYRGQNRIMQASADVCLFGLGLAVEVGGGNGGGMVGLGGKAGNSSLVNPLFIFCVSAREAQRKLIKSCVRIAP